MRLQAYTHEELYSLCVAIVRSVTGVRYPFTKRTWHRAIAQVISMFAANTNIETLRLIKGNSLEGLRGQLLERRALEAGITKHPASAARVAGRFVRLGAIGAPVSILPNTIFMRAATATQSEIAFRSEAAALIGAADTESNLIFGSCTETGDKGNNISSGDVLTLKNPVTNVSHFRATTDSGGGFGREDDPALRSRAYAAKRGHGECTWSGIENLLTSIELSTGRRITSARVFEAFDEPAPFYTGITYAIIDDTSGDPNLIGPIDNTTYQFGSPSWWQFDATGYHIYIRTDNCPFELWNDGVNAILERNNGAGWVIQTGGVDYWVNDDNGTWALAAPLVVGQSVRTQFNFYTGLVKEAAKYINGVYLSESIRGWKPAGYPIRVRPPQGTTVYPTVSGALSFLTGWDSTFGRIIAETNVLAYLNSLPIGDAARYDVVQGIVHKTPGISYASNLLLDGGTVDIPPTHKFGVVRGDASLISF